MIGGNNIISTKRLSTVSGKSTYSAYLSSVECYLEPASQEIIAQLNGIHGYKAWVLISNEIIDLEEGDHVTDQDSNEYTVYSVSHFKDNIEIDNHTEAILRKNAG